MCFCRLVYRSSRSKLKTRTTPKRDSVGTSFFDNRRSVAIPATSLHLVEQNRQSSATLNRWNCLRQKGSMPKKWSLLCLRIPRPSARVRPPARRARASSRPPRESQTSTWSSTCRKVRPWKPCAPRTWPSSSRPKKPTPPTSSPRVRATPPTPASSRSSPPSRWRSSASWESWM
ncbi:MAG: hypothetical protein BWY75_02852 [bacterium ADurb.Bin425]|nr:MAG: hypothetical protein BWY75_02852 [bacterium ADurb.Bin425]